MFDQFEMYQKFMEDEEFAEWYTNKMFEADYRFGNNIHNKKQNRWGYFSICFVHSIEDQYLLI